MRAISELVSRIGERITGDSGLPLLHVEVPEVTSLKRFEYTFQGETFGRAYSFINDAAHRNGARAQVTTSFSERNDIDQALLGKTKFDIRLHLLPFDSTPPHRRLRSFSKELSTLASGQQQIATHTHSRYEGLVATYLQQAFDAVQTEVLEGDM